MDKADHKTLAAIVKKHAERYNCPVSEAQKFGIMMAGYSDSGKFFLEAAAEALEDWNSHGAAAICRRLCNGSLGANSALAAMELQDAAQDALDCLEAHMTDEDQEEGGCAYAAIEKIKAVLRNVRGENQAWRFWDANASERLK